MVFKAGGGIARPRTGVFALLTVGLLAACGQDAPFDSPRFPFAANWRKSQAGAPVLLNNVAWWRRMKDPTLDALVARALTGNLDIAIARERIVNSQAALKAIPDAAIFSPSVSLQQQGGTGIATQRIGDGTLGLNWLLDPWGGRRSTLKSAAARIKQAEAERDAAQLLVLSNLAGAYLDLRYRQQLLVQGLDDLRRRKQTLSLTNQRQDAGSATRTDTTRSAARVAEIESMIPGLQAAIEAKKNEIAVLVGVAPGQLGIDLGQARQPRPGVSPQMGIPADLLRNRPDIRVAEQSYYQALANLGTARAALFPSLSLVGSISLQSAGSGKSATQYAFGPTVNFPTLSKGGVEARESEVRQAYTQWTQTVLSAILEVENALLDYQAVTRSLSAAERSVQLYREVRDQEQKVFTLGDATLSDLIDADADVARANATLAEARYRQALAYVSLNVRIGAGNSAGPGGTN